MRQFGGGAHDPFLQFPLQQSTFSLQAKSFIAQPVLDEGAPPVAVMVLPPLCRVVPVPAPPKLDAADLAPPVGLPPVALTLVALEPPALELVPAEMVLVVPSETATSWSRLQPGEFPNETEPSVMSVAVVSRDAFMVPPTS